MSASAADLPPPHLDAGAVRRTLREAGLHARHSLSQNFLTDVDVLDAILAEAAPRPGRRVLEIGPGLGILTGGLLAAGGAVTAIELDHGLAARLRSVCAGAIERAAADPLAPGGLRLIEGDALDQPLGELLAPPWDVVANLPYHVTSPVLHRLLEAAPRPERAVLMVQREVAERIAAAPGSMSYLSVFVQAHAAVRVAFRVPPSAFEPEPGVSSAVIVVEPWVGGPLEALAGDDVDGLWRIVQAAFRERRKMIHNVLVRQLPVAPARVAAALEATGIAPTRRPQTLSVAEWLALRSGLGPIGADPPGQRRARGGEAPDRAVAERPA